MAEKDVVITYETLFELLRIEKNREDLQKLEETFFSDVLQYLKDKRADFETTAESQSTLFAADEKEKARLEYENIKKILKDLYDHREKKIVRTAVNKARTGALLLNASNMLPCERMLLDSLSAVMGEFRKNILFKLASGELPTVDSLPETITDTINGSLNGTDPVLSTDTPPGLVDNADTVDPADEIPPEATPIPDTDEDVAGGVHFRTSEEPKELKTSPSLTETSSNVQKVRVLAAIGEIVGPDLQIYGPYDEGAVIDLPGELASVLVEKKQAEQVIN